MKVAKQKSGWEYFTPCSCFVSWWAVDKFISVPELLHVRNPGWDTEKADWDKFRSVIQHEVNQQMNGINSLDNLSDALARALTKGLNLAVGKRSSAPLFSRHIVALIKERKELEMRFKSEKSRLSASRHQAQPPSPVVAKDNLDAGGLTKQALRGYKI